MVGRAGSKSAAIAVVTGAARGIGAAIAAKLAQDGCTLALLDFDGGAGDAYARQLTNAGHVVRHWAVDCAELDAVERVFDEISHTFGAPEILVNNAGGGARAKSTDFVACDVRTFETVLAGNLKSTVYCSRQVVAAMKDNRRGKIVNIASEAPFIGGAKCWDYSAAKAGVIGFTRSIAQELAPFRVNVNAVGPGVTRTRVFTDWSVQAQQEATRTNPMGRVGEPNEIAEAVAYLASDRAAFITGQTLLVNGGHWMI